MRRSLVAAALGVAACNPPTPPGLDIDIAPECDDIAVALREDDVLPGWTIVAAAVERSGESGAWYLGLDPNKRLWLRRTPEDVPPLELTGIGQPEEFQLQPGPNEGEVWLMHSADGVVRLWRYDDGSDALASSGELTGFLSGEWDRRLVFVGREPYLLSYSRQATRLQIELIFDEVTPELGIDTRWNAVAAFVCTDVNDAACQNDAPREATLLDIAEPGNVAGALALFGLTTPAAAPSDPQQPLAYETSLISVKVQDNPGGPGLAVTRRDHVTWFTGGAVRPSPGELAADGLSLYLLGGLSPAPDTPNTDATSWDSLLQADLFGGQPGADNDTIGVFEKSKTSHLLQLGDRVALGQVSGSAWTVWPIEGSRVDTNVLGELEVGAGARVLPAGRSHFVLTADDAPTRRVQIGCAAD